MYPGIGGAPALASGSEIPRKRLEIGQKPVGRASGEPLDSLLFNNIRVVAEGSNRPHLLFHLEVFGDITREVENHNGGPGGQVHLPAIKLLLIPRWEQ